MRKSSDIQYHANLYNKFHQTSVRCQYCNYISSDFCKFHKFIWLWDLGFAGGAGFAMD